MRPKGDYILRFTDHKDYLSKSKLVQEAVDELNKMMIVYCDERGIKHHEVNGVVEVIDIDSLSKQHLADIVFMEKAIVKPAYKKILVRQLSAEL